MDAFECEHMLKFLHARQWVSVLSCVDRPAVSVSVSQQPADVKVCLILPHFCAQS